MGLFKTFWFGLQSITYICIPNPLINPIKQLLVDFSSFVFIFQHTHSRPVSPALQWNATQMIENVETLSCSQFSSLSIGKGDDTRRQQLFPHQRRWRHFRRLSHCGTDKAFESSWLRVNAEWHSTTLLLFQNELMDYLFDLSHRAQVLLKAIIKLGISDGLKVTGVNTAGGCGVAAFAHACVVAESTLVQVRVSQGILCWNPLWRIKHQHPAEEVDSFMGCLARQCVQNRKGWLFVRSSENVRTSTFTCRPHRLHRGSPQQVSD